MNPLEAPVLALVGAMLPAMRSMPASFLAARRAERALRAAPGCAAVHRWASRRSLLLTSWWTDRASAEAALAMPAVRAFLDGARRRGAVAWTALYALAPGGYHDEAPSIS